MVRRIGDATASVGHHGAMTDASDSALPSSRAAEAEEASSGGPKRLLLLAGAVVVVLLIAGAIALALQGDDEDRVWPPELGGRAEGLGQVNEPAPTVEVTAEPGVYLWSDFDGWHLWVVNGEGVSGVSGTIVADDDVGEGTLAVEGAGELTVDESSFTFDLPGEPALVGLDFNPGFYTGEMVIDLEGPDGPIDPALVTFGRSGSAETMPIVLEQIERPASDE